MTHHIRRMLVLMFLIDGLAAIAVAHPAHVSMAEIEFNDETQRIECAMRVHSADFERALRQRVGHAIDLEKTKSIDRAIIDYVSDRFVVATAADKSTKLIWVGKEVADDHTWLYFEVPAPGGLIGTTVRNQMFFDQFPDQINLLTYRWRKDRRTIWFSSDQVEYKLDFARREPKLQRSRGLPPSILNTK